jgi:hypothetical protein
MPAFVNILENKVLGPEFKRGLEQGELNLLRRQIAKRFGAIPVWAEKRLSSFSAMEVEEVGERIVNAKDLEELLNTRPAA